MKKNSSILLNKEKITSIAIGGFDGMHLAHQELFKKLDNNGAIIVIETGYANLTPFLYRQEYTSFPIVQYFLNEIKHLSGEEFILELKKQFANLKKIVVGYDFHFGKNRMYSINELKKMFDGEVIVVDEIKLDDLEIHSRNIREHLKKSELSIVNKLLKRNYKIYGKHIKGQGLGAKSFVPTINLLVEDFLLPSSGVYVTKTIYENKEFESISFIGHRVSTDGSFAVETHLFNYNETENISDEIAIEFISKIRENKKFDSFEDLKNKIEDDINICLEYFKVTIG